LLANRVFGGTFASRLVHRIRGKERLSYGVNSGVSVSAKDDGGQCGTRAFCDELARALKDGFTAEEVAAKKKALLEAAGGRKIAGWFARDDAFESQAIRENDEVRCRSRSAHRRADR